MPQISFNGKTYNSLEEMPAGERVAYEHIVKIFKDANQNGVPDIFEGNLMTNMMSLASSAVVVNGGQSYTLENMPPEVRAKYDQAMTKLKQAGLIPAGTVIPGWDSAPILATASAPIAPQAPAAPQGSPSAIQEDSGPKLTGILVAVFVALLVCVAAVIVGFLVFNGG